MNEKIRNIITQIFALFLPFVYLMITVVFIVNPSFLAFEYQKPGFPPDEYGFTLTDRIQYGSKTIAYMVNVQNTNLAELTDRNGDALYKPNEIAHMADVRFIFQTCRWVLAGFIALFLILLGSSYRDHRALTQLLTAIYHGSLLALACYILIVVLSLVMFNEIFLIFHRIFFEEGSWLFYTSDTLIRLFPYQFWVDAFMIVGIFASILASFVAFATKKLTMKVKIDPKGATPLKRYVRNN